MVFLITLLLYWLTLCPTVYVGDTGELLAAAQVLGIPHPTGYPLYLLLVKGFAAIFPVGSFAFRANVCSALCAAAAAQVLAAATRRLGAPRLVAACCGLAFAFLEPIWSQAVVARTYALAGLVSTILVWLSVRAWQEPRARWWNLHQLVLGLGLANHLMVIAHLPVSLLLALARPGRRALGAWLVSLTLLLPGLSLYAYLPVRAAAEPAVAFRVPVEGSAGVQLARLDAPRPLVSYLRRELLHQNHWMESPVDLAVIAGHHLLLLRELFLGVPLLLLGVAAAWRRQRAWLLAAALLWVGNLLPLALHGAWWDIFLYPRYMTVSWTLVMVVVSFGATALVEGWRRRFPAGRGAAALVLLLPGALVLVNFHRCNRSEHTLAEDYARTLFAELPEGAQFGSAADNALYPMMYLHFVEGVRPDVRLVNETQMVGAPDSARPIFSPDPPETFPRRRRQAVDLLSRFQKPEEPFSPLPELQPLHIAGLDGEIFLDAISVSLVAQIHADRAEAWAQRGQWDAARASLQQVLRFRAGRPWGYHRGALVCFELVRQAFGGSSSIAQARSDLDLADRLLELAREYGDPRDPAVPREEAFVQGYRHLLGAVEQRGTEDGFRNLEAGVKLLPHEVGWQKSYLQALVATGRKDQARAHLEWLRSALPDDPAVADLEDLVQ